MTGPGSLLVVDDDELDRDMLCRRLELNGYEVTRAEGGLEALALADRHAYDLILLGVMMPDLNGLEVLRILRGRASSAELPVIMVTARDEGPDIVEAFNLGANDYVTRPIDMPVVLARIASQVTRRRAQSALRISEERYALAAQGAKNGLWDWDLRTNQVYFSPRWKALLGYQDEEVGNDPDEWFRRVHGADLAQVVADLDAHRRGGTPHFEREFRMLHRDSSYRWMLARGVAVQDGDGRGLRMAGSLTDITEGKVADALTGLPNRILLMDRIARAIERSRHAPEHRFAVLFLDLDRFKLVNDSLGHMVGDQLLHEFARRLERCLRATDTLARPLFEHTIARLGGDEFTVLLDGIRDPSNAVLVAERILRELTAPFHLDGHDVYTSVSIGITLGGADDRAPEDVLRDADTAMYDAKSRGKSRFEVFDAAMRDRVVARLQLETELRQALERREFRVHYQPIVRLEDGTLTGFEALLRWHHPEHGLLPPAEFIPTAEETGLILPIGWWALEEACRQMASWLGRFPSVDPLVMCVNLSSKQFFQPGLFDRIERQLRETGLQGRHLKLEITERSIMSDPDAASAALTRLRALGVRVGIDDFGTGYSSLSYLCRFPIDTLKIDRSFIQQMVTDDKDREIVQAIVTLAHNLIMDVVAEGVETPFQRDQLQGLGCEYGQGFYFSKSVTAANAELFLVPDQFAPGLPYDPARNGHDTSAPRQPAGPRPGSGSDPAQLIPY